MASLAPLLLEAAPTLISAAGSFLGTMGGAANSGAMNALNNEQDAFQTGLYAQQIQHQQQMSLQSTAFDEMMDEQSENMREINTLRDVNMQERKADNSITKKFIESITE